MYLNSLSIFNNFLQLHSFSDSELMIDILQAQQNAEEINLNVMTTANASPNILFAMDNLTAKTTVMKRCVRHYLLNTKYIWI